MKLFSIPSGNFKLDGGAMFGVVPKSIWSKIYPSDDNNMIPLSMRCLLVVDGERKVLIDNGIGNKQGNKFFGHYHLFGDENLSGSLKQIGLTPADITDMFLTHLHFDHAGGSINLRNDGTGFEPAFPNARYWVSNDHWNWANNPNRREKASFLKENIIPILESGQLNLFDAPFELLKGFQVKTYDGHTAGQAIPFIKYKGRTIVYMADFIPTSAHVPLPYIMSYDTQPLKSLTEKEKFLEEAVDNSYILFFEHDAFSECCTLIRTEKGIKVNKKGTLEEFLAD
ncbi:MAG: MBL fold metallo-hydrolase [Bacteroidetes bacterium]|nr:MBL fold metallo-hydrolase [Bacteroidota bacterium]